MQFQAYILRRCIMCDFNTVKLSCSISSLGWWMDFKISFSKSSTIVSKLAWNPSWVYACVMFSLSHVKKKMLQCNHDTLNICHLNHLERVLNRLQCKLATSFQSWNEWRLCPGLKQFINLPSASFLYFLALTLLLSFNLPLPLGGEDLLPLYTLYYTQQQNFSYTSGGVMFISVAVLCCRWKWGRG